MIEANSYQQGVTPGAMAKLPTPVSFPSGLACSRLRTEVVVEVKNNDVAAQDYTFARAKKAAACLFGFISNWFGEKAKDIFDNAVTLVQLREWIIANTDDDLVVGGKFWSDYANDAVVIKAGVAAGAAFQLKIEVPRPFELTRLGRDAALWAPGATQMAMLHSEVKRLGAADFDTDGKFVQNKPAEFLMLFDTIEAHEDNWSNVPRLYVNKEVGKLNHAPAGELAMTAIYERSKTGVDTIAEVAGTLGLFSVKRAGEAPVHENVRAARVATDALYGRLPSAADINALVTPLHHLPQNVDPNDIPTGAGWLLEMPGAEIAGGAEVGYCYVPAFDEAYAESVVRPNLVGGEGKPSRVLLTNSLAKQGRSVTSKLATFAPRAIVQELDPAYHTIPGDVADVNAPKLMPSLPKPVILAAGDVAKTGDGQAIGAAKAIAKFQVGGTTATRGRRTARFGELVSSLRR